MAVIEGAAIRKRQQIDSSKKTMFMAVATVAFVSGVALVVSFFLIQQIRFYTKITSAKNATIKTINKNIEQAKKLKEEIRVLDTDEALSSVKIKEDGSALQVILDALPAEANADALGASLQQAFVQPVDGLNLDSLSVDTIDEDLAPGEMGEIGFRMTVLGSADSLKDLLRRFERSIRVVTIKHINIEVSKDDIRMAIQGEAYYQTAQVVGLKEEKIPPGGSK